MPGGKSNQPNDDDLRSASDAMDRYLARHHYTGDVAYLAKSDAMVELWLQSHAQFIRNLVGFGLRILKWRLIDQLRCQGREPETVPLDAVAQDGQSLADSIPDDHTNFRPEDLMGKAAAIKELQWLTSKLTPDQKEALIGILEEESVLETADRLDKSEGAMKELRKRAKKAVKKMAKDNPPPAQGGRGNIRI